MSTTLLPPTYYLVRPRGGRSQAFPTVAQAAGALVQFVPVPVTVSAVTGMRARSLTESELTELRAHVRRARLRARRAGQCT